MSNAYTFQVIFALPGREMMVDVTVEETNHKDALLKATEKSAELSPDGARTAYLFIKSVIYSDNEKT